MYAFSCKYVTCCFCCYCCRCCCHRHCCWLVLFFSFWEEQIMYRSLSLSHFFGIFSKICTIAMFVIFVLKVIFHMCFVGTGVFMIYLHTKFYVPSFIGSVIISIKLKYKYLFHTAAFYQKIHNKNCVLFRGQLPYVISRPYSKWR
jgi:hypothetical protein